MPVVEAETAQPLVEAVSSDSDSEEASVASWADLNLPDLDDASRQAIIDSIRASAASDEDEEDEELMQMLADPAQTDLGKAEDRQITPEMHTSDRSAGPEVESSAVSDASSNAAETASSASEPTSRSDEASELKSSPATSTAEGATGSEPRHQHLQTAHNELEDDERDEYRQWDQDYWEQRDPQAVDNALAAAQIWSRIIRTPRKRGKHIIVDVCSPQQDESASSGVNASQGHLVRQVIATTDKRTWLGPAGYRLVRKSRWGDLWPKFYQDYALTQKTGRD